MFKILKKKENIPIEENGFVKIELVNDQIEISTNFNKEESANFIISIIDQSLMYQFLSILQESDKVFFEEVIKTSAKRAALLIKENQPEESNLKEDLVVPVVTKLQGQGQ